MSSLHVFINKSDGHDEVNVEMIDDIYDEAHHDDQTGVFEVCHLDVHGSELYSPANFGSLRRWGLESEGVPVGGLDIFKVAYKVVIIKLFLNEFTFISRHRVSNKQPCNVFSKSIINIRVLL